jgi:2,3-bisphosphoglycerate-dependent phosphoglycerate mutase
MTHFYLIRHGRTAWNNEDRLQGWADPPLDDIGLVQAGALAARLHAVAFDALYSSPLLRARQTAETLAQPHGLPLTLDGRLRERSVGDWTGLTLDEARAQAPDRFHADWRQAGAPGGEAQAALTARVAAVFEEIVAARPASTVAVVSHGGALSAVLAHLLGIPAHQAVSFSFHNTAIARLSVTPNGGGGQVRLISLGDDRHLES